MSDPNERITLEELAIRTRDGLVQNALTELPKDSAPSLIRSLGNLLLESAAEMDGESTTIATVNEAKSTHQVIKDEVIQAEFDKLDATSEAHPRIRRGIGTSVCDERKVRRIPLRNARPRHIPTRQSHETLMEELTVDEMLVAHVDMPHMKPADDLFSSETTEPEIFNENTQVIVESLMARWRGISQAKHEEGAGRVGRFFAATLDAVGYDREANDEIATIKAVEVDRVLQIATQMIANGQDVSKLTAKYPAVKDLGRFLRTWSYDAPSSSSEVYRDKSDRTTGGNIVAPTKSRVILDGEVLNWIEAEDALNAELLRITADYSADKAVSGVK